MSKSTTKASETAGKELCASSPDTPLILFIIFCVLVIIVMVSVRTYQKGPPSITTMGSQSFMSVLSCFILITIGLISVYAEWAVMILFVLGILFFMISVLDPNLFFYDQTS